MQKKIVLGNQRICYALRKSRQVRNIRLSIRRDGNLMVSVPRGVRQSFVERILREKASWILEKIAESQNNARERLSRDQTIAIYKQYRDHALALAENRIRELNARYQFEFNRITIRNQTSRWGSCSKKKNISFNYRIALLRPDLADYIIVHELCHLEELNHSPKFWTLVSRTFPNHREVRKELRKIKLGA